MTKWRHLASVTIMECEEHGDLKGVIVNTDGSASWVSAHTKSSWDPEDSPGFNEGLRNLLNSVHGHLRHREESTDAPRSD